MAEDGGEVEKTAGLENYRQVTKEDVEEPSLVFRFSPHIEMVHAEHQVGHDGQHHRHQRHWDREAFSKHRGFSRVYFLKKFIRLNPLE